MYPRVGARPHDRVEPGRRIVDADTEINAVDPTFKWGLLPDDPAQAAMASEVDLQNALTHELGHVLGLDHPCYLGAPPSPEARSTTRARPCSRARIRRCRAPCGWPRCSRRRSTGSIAERTLSADEIAALHDLYPPVVAPGPALSDRAGGCRLAGDGPPTPFALLVVALALAGRRRRVTEGSRRRHRRPLRPLALAPRRRRNPDKNVVRRIVADARVG